MNATILLTSVGAPGFDAAFRAIRQFEKICGIDLRIVGIDSDPSAYGSHFVDKFISVPLYTHVDFSSILLDIIEDEHISFILPLGDYELVTLATHVPELCFINSLKTLSIVQSKACLTRELLRHESTRPYCIDFVMCGNLPCVKDFLQSLRHRGCLPCLKPTKTSGSRGFAMIKEFDFLKWGKEKTAYAFIDEGVFIDSVKNTPREDIMLMEYITGDEYSVDCYIPEKENKKPTIITRLRSKVTAGICTHALIIENESIINAAKNIISVLGLRGNINMQFKLPHLNATPKLLEINPRLAGTVEACNGAGISMIALELGDYFGLKNYSSELKWGTVMIRTYKELFIYESNAFFMGEGV